LPDTHAALAVRHHFADAEQQKDASTLGMWIFLVTEIMFFGGMFSHGNKSAPRKLPKKWLCILLASIFCAFLLRADLESSYLLPLDNEAIRYATEPLTDSVIALQERLKKGDAKLEFDPQFGYLPAVLRELEVPVSSQILVFSKTSFQSPRSHRARRAPSITTIRSRSVSLEAATWSKSHQVDPREGVIFYTLDQEKTDKPRFARREQCLQCHISSATRGVPGEVVGSVHTDNTGMPVFQAGTFVTDHRSPLKDRWGGWYVKVRTDRRRIWVTW